MKASVLIVLFLVVGLIGGLYNIWPAWLLDDQLSSYALYGLVLLVGLSIGTDKSAFAVIKRLSAKVILIPLSVVVGSLLGASAIVLFSNKIGLQDAMAVGAGFGYYSLSSILIGQLSSEEVGVIALLSNVFREILTFVLAPVLVPVFGKLTTIAFGGATSMDTTLPIVVKHSGKEYAIIALFSGVILSLLVPILIGFIYQW